MHPPLEVHQHPACKEVRLPHGTDAARPGGPGGAMCAMCSACDGVSAARLAGWAWCACRRPPTAARPQPTACRLPAPLQCILALKACHRDNPIAKYWGECNAAAYALNICLAEEKVTRRCSGALVSPEGSGCTRFVPGTCACLAAGCWAAGLLGRWAAGLPTLSSTHAQALLLPACPAAGLPTRHASRWSRSGCGRASSPSARRRRQQRQSARACRAIGPRSSEASLQSSHSSHGGAQQQRRR
jgi:hypothetical protein